MDRAARKIADSASELMRHLPELEAEAAGFHAGAVDSEAIRDHLDDAAGLLIAIRELADYSATDSDAPVASIQLGLRELAERASGHIQSAYSLLMPGAERGQPA